VAYSQTANFTYTVPLNKIPALDWTTLRLGYGSSYSWTGASTLAVQLGNYIQNNQKRDASADLNLSRLYAKWRLLRELDQQSSPSPPNLPGQKNDSLNKNNPQRNATDQKHLTGVRKACKILTSVKDITINFSEVSSSTIYGYTDSTKFLGMDLKTKNPGWGYVFGEQPDTSYVNRLAKKGVLTHDTLFNYQNQASYNQIITIAAQIQPVRDLNISLNVSKSFGKNYTELYKDTTGSNTFARLNPYTAGSFSISFISVKTLLKTTTQTRSHPHSRLLKTTALLFPSDWDYKTHIPPVRLERTDMQKGYGKYAQDVLIPAFILVRFIVAAIRIRLHFVKEDNPNIQFNPFSGYLPKPNLAAHVNGLARIPGMEKYLPVSAFRTDITAR
jgi:cell surface protein SprA